PERDTRHESDREEHHRVSSFLRPRRRLVWRALEQTSCHGARFLGDATATGACALSRHSQNPTLLSLVPPDVAAASKASGGRDRPGDAYGSLISELNRSPNPSGRCPGPRSGRMGPADKGGAR